MLITQRHRYALRAVFELAKQGQTAPVKLADIADAQAIPRRFLEVIMAQLRERGLVESKRGFTGGYRLRKAPGRISVGEIFRILEDSDQRTRCNACITGDDCPLTGNCVFLPLWNKLQSAIENVYDNTSIQDLMNPTGVIDFSGDLLFTYGTLQVPEVMTAVTGKRFDGTPAELEGYRCFRVKNADYPGIVSEIGAKTTGTLIRGVTDQDLNLLDRFEGELYRRQSATVVTATGNVLKTWVYVVEERFRHRISESPWSLEEFLNTGYNRFMKGFVARPWNHTS